MGAVKGRESLVCFFPKKHAPPTPGDYPLSHHATHPRVRAVCTTTTTTHASHVTSTRCCTRKPPPTPNPRRSNATTKRVCKPCIVRWCPLALHVRCGRRCTDKGGAPASRRRCASATCTLTVAVATALARLTRDAALAECCRAYHASCDVYERAARDHARLMDELMLEAARLDALRRASDEAC